MFTKLRGISTAVALGIKRRLYNLKNQYGCNYLFVKNVLDTIIFRNIPITDA